MSLPGYQPDAACTAPRAVGHRPFGQPPVGVMLIRGAGVGVRGVGVKVSIIATVWPLVYGLIRFGECAMLCKWYKSL